MSFISHFHNVVYFGYGQKNGALVVPNSTNSVNTTMYYWLHIDSYVHSHADDTTI
jgi:hypothetical protein